MRADMAIGLSELLDKYHALETENEMLRGKVQNCVHALTFAIDGWDESDPFITKLRATRDGAKAAIQPIA